MVTCPAGIEGPAAAPTPAESPTVLFVGTWAGRKRGAFLHRIFTEEVVHRIPNAQLWMVSDHCVETDRVRWFARPSDDELGELYSRAWVLAAPSLYEGFGLYYLEAMASETMVVASPNPRVHVRPRSGQGGPAGGGRQLRPAIAEALESDDMRAGYVARGRERAGDFSWAKAVEDHIQRLRARDRALVACALERTRRAGAGWARSRSAARRPFCASAGPERRSPSRRGPAGGTGSRGVPRPDRGSSGAAGEPGSPSRSP